MIAVVFLLAGSAARADPPIVGPPVTDTAFVAPVAHDFVVATLRKQLQVEHRRYVAATHRVRQLTRTLTHRSSVREAISLACNVYGSCSTLWRKAGCESHYSPTAQNASGAAGLFQFLPSTWASTPFAAFSIWSPYANALAAGWMHAHGRSGEWVCR